MGRSLCVGVLAGDVWIHVRERAAWVRLLGPYVQFIEWIEAVMIGCSGKTE